MEKVLDVLKTSEEALKSKEISEIAGIDKKEIDKAIKKLKKEDKVYSPKRCYYSIR
ncbi:MarR family transcriptional regulator [Caldisalinibacter kiritimatiensis]|nr:MarR family transcriptional regulator [Caldisalinibacter kiritimatiensis]